MTYINIDTILNDIDDFAFAKRIIETEQIKNGTLDNKRSINEFILYLNLQNSIYMFNNIVIPFSIQKTKDDTYIFYVNQSKIDITDFKHKLEKIKYDLSNTKSISNTQIIEMGLDKNSFFIINNKYYI